MYSLTLTCPPERAPYLAAELWDWNALAISESDGSILISLAAGFETDADSQALLSHFAQYNPIWAFDDTDWIAETKDAWPARVVGQRLFLAPLWCEDPTPDGRVRVVHNPGLASGTGEHPCTQLALEALEQCVAPGSLVIDVGTGSGILALSATLLGAREAVGTDTDLASLATAQENYRLNGLAAALFAGSADALADSVADLIVANISGSVLLAILDELLRVSKPDATVILTGFTDYEAARFLKFFPLAEVTARNEWRCLVIPLSSYEP